MAGSAAVKLKNASFGWFPFKKVTVLTVNARKGTMVTDIMHSCIWCKILPLSKLPVGKLNYQELDTRFRDDNLQKKVP